MNAFDKCALPEVCFAAFGNEEKQAIHINNSRDYDDNFIFLSEKRDDDEWINLAGEYKLIKDQIKQQEKRLAQLRDALVSMSRAACSTGGGLMIEQCERKGAVKYSAIPQLLSVDLEHYRSEPIKYWKVTEI